MKKLNLIFLSTLLLILIFGTTSFANVQMNEETAQYILNYFSKNLKLCSFHTPKEEWFETAKNIIKSASAKKLQQVFNDNFNTMIKYSGDYSFNNITVFGACNSAGYPNLFFLLSNNTYGADDLNYIDLRDLFNNQLTIKGAKNENQTGLELYGVRINIQPNNVMGAYEYKINNYDNYGYIYQDEPLITYNDDLTIAYVKSFLGLSNIQTIYVRDVNNISKAYFLGDTYNADNSTPIIPDTPSGDNSGDTSGDSGGGTTTPSGDTGGGTTTPNYNEKLDNIQGSLNDIKDKIPTSGDIAGATTQANKNYWGDTEQMNGEDYENEINQGINDSMDKITGKLEQNKIYSSIAIAEQKIIDLFLEKPEDFKISWKDVMYMDKKLIPAGEINFSQMCRDNEVLGRVKNTLNIIVSAMISLSLFKYIFNLIMVTLGIDHPLILETQENDITEITNTKIGNKTYVTKKTYKSDRKRG